MPIYLQFAGDLAVIANDRENIEYTVKKLMEEYEKWKLIVNNPKNEISMH